MVMSLCPGMYILRIYHLLCSLLTTSFALSVLPNWELKKPQDGYRENFLFMCFKLKSKHETPLDASKVGQVHVLWQQNSYRIDGTPKN